jgi:hypothetical protein
MFTVYFSCMRVKKTVWNPPLLKLFCYITREAHVYSFCFLNDNKEVCVVPLTLTALCYIRTEAHINSFCFLNDSKVDWFPPTTEVPLLHHEGRLIFTVSLSYMIVKEIVSTFPQPNAPCYITTEANIYSFCFLH